VNGFEAFLEEGEQIAWADSPRRPRLLRALGLPPRGTAHLFAHALALTGLAGLLVVGATDGSPALIAAGAAPLLAVGALWGWSARRSARTAYALSDRGRGFLRQGSEVWVFQAPPAASARCDADQEVGDVILGELDVRVGGEDRRLAVLFRDVAYPGSVLKILRDHRP
jgi:hypothetical protein